MNRIQSVRGTLVRGSLRVWITAVVDGWFIASYHCSRFFTTRPAGFHWAHGCWVTVTDLNCPASPEASCGYVSKSWPMEVSRNNTWNLEQKDLPWTSFPESVSRTEPSASLCPCNLEDCSLTTEKTDSHLVSVTGFGTCAHSSHSWKGSDYVSLIGVLQAG